MIQSDALSRRSDLYPDEDHDNEDQTLLPNSLFVNLIDTELQRQIAHSGKLDFDAANAIKLLLGTASSKQMKNLEDWTTEEFEGQNILFYKGKNYIPDDIRTTKEG